MLSFSTSVGLNVQDLIKNALTGMSSMTLSSWH